MVMNRQAADRKAILTRTRDKMAGIARKPDKVTDSVEKDGCYTKERTRSERCVLDITYMYPNGPFALIPPPPRHT
jgi:hypothetical protein